MLVAKHKNCNGHKQQNWLVVNPLMVDLGAGQTYTIDIGEFNTPTHVDEENLWRVLEYISSYEMNTHVCLENEAEENREDATAVKPADVFWNKFYGVKASSAVAPDSVVALFGMINNDDRMMYQSYLLVAHEKLSAHMLSFWDDDNVPIETDWADDVRDVVWLCTCGGSITFTSDTRRYVCAASQQPIKYAS